MPRVNTKKKSRAGTDRFCGRCGAKIEPGESYFTWSFRYGGQRFNCFRHRPRQSELTQSLMGEVYAAIEAAQDAMDTCKSTEDLRALIENVADTAEGVAEQYRDAAEPFGGAGENAERADELEGWVGDLQSFDPGEAEEVDTDEIKDQMEAEGFSPDDEAEWTSVYEQRVAEAEENDTALDDAKGEAQELLGGCPL